MFSYFYHQRLRKTVAVFGAVFNNIYVLRQNSSGETISQVKVPLSYAPKEKYLERIRENPDLYNDTKVALKLPRMSFEITNLNYDGERALPKLNTFKKNGSSTEASKFFTPAPYLINFQLNIYSKTQDDALQIVEQILPYFNPQYTLSLKPFGDYPTIKEDIPITIQGVTFSDDFEGQVESRRTIIYTLEFEMKINFYGPVDDNAPLIDTAITDVHIIGEDSDGKVSTITVTPDPADASPDSDFGFNIDIENYYE